MKIQAYQFIKYNLNTTLEHLEKVFSTGAVVCFDFEDGIVNPLAMDMSATLKEDARNQFIVLQALINNFKRNIKVGVRLNNISSTDFEKDLIKIQGLTLDSIFVPKIEHPDDIHLLFEKLNEFRIEYKNLIPIIETKMGFDNIESIFQSNQKLSQIAFGHCDYNLDIDAYPFFHQDSWQYWKWITAITAKCEKYRIQLINSPYLNTDNESFFSEMIAYISTRKDHFSGQVTLSTRQSALCNSGNYKDLNFRKNLENKNRISVGKEFALEIVNEFESNNKQKGLSKSNNKFISLQEYLASKKLVNDNRTINEICFIGGCFPVQHNIVFEDLFHQILRRKVEQKYNNKLNVNLLRYERFCTVLDKLKVLTDLKKLDFIIFHVRPEPYLRLIKLFYKYTDNQGKRRWSFNLPFLNMLNPEQFDMYEIGRMFQAHNKQRESFVHKFLLSCNYLLGEMIGNKHYALKRYSQITTDLIVFCNANNIKYQILGPNRRNNNYMEPSLCRDLDLYFSNCINKQNFICGFEHDNSHKMNQKNGIHVTQEYHDLIAEKIYYTIVDKGLLKEGVF